MYRACELKDQTYKKTRTLHFSDQQTTWEPARPLQRSLGPFGRPEMPKESRKCFPGLHGKRGSFKSKFSSLNLWKNPGVSLAENWLNSPRVGQDCLKIGSKWLRVAQIGQKPGSNRPTRQGFVSQLRHREFTQESWGEGGRSEGAGVSSEVVGIPIFILYGGCPFMVAQCSKLQHKPFLSDDVPCRRKFAHD